MWADKQGGNAAKVGHIKNGNDGWEDMIRIQNILLYDENKDHDNC